MTNPALIGTSYTFILDFGVNTITDEVGTYFGITNGDALKNFNQEILIDIEIEEPLKDFEFTHGTYNSTHLTLYFP